MNLDHTPLNDKEIEAAVLIVGLCVLAIALSPVLLIALRVVFLFLGLGVDLARYVLQIVLP